jgi:hypothetical protein
MAAAEISHAFVLPDENFEAWLAALRAYTKKFTRVAIVRSPRGNDLNRYRNVTAVAAPLTWFQEDPVAHIRRIYPQVVGIDVIYATTPARMEQVLAERIANNDRYGDKQTNPPHLFARFVLEYPTTYRPMRITGRFANAAGTANDNIGMDFASQNGSRVIAAADGKITRVYTGSTDDALQLGRYVQVTTSFSGSTYVVTYGRLRTVNISLNQTVKLGDTLGEAAGESFKVVVQQPGAGFSDMRLPNVVDPTPMMYVQNLRVRPLENGLRLRTLPSTDGTIMAQVNTWDTLETLELHGRTLGKLGVQNEWLKVKTADGRQGFAAAWFLEATIKGDFFAGLNPVGVNLDALHPLGAPAANRLGELGWVRLGYNVSDNRGSEDINAAYNRYAPLAERYARAGYKVMFVVTHQTYGEGKQEYWPWNAMTNAKWQSLIDRFGDMMERIAKQYAGKGIVHSWQIWNEQDAGPDAIASVPVPPGVYGTMLTQVIRAIRTHDRDAYLITGGHIAGPSPAAIYARDTLKVMPGDIRPDGIAVHPYGRGPQPGEPYAIFGHIDDLLQSMMKVQPGLPIWITEWGVLDRGFDPPANISNYALSFINYVKNKYGDKVASMIWYAWAETMHNGYGIVDQNSNPRALFTEQFLKA